MNKNILVTGGSGMVGRSLQDIMPDAIYLSSKDCDLTNPIETELLIKYHKPNVIIHLAAKVGGIIDNINKPAEYFDDNVIMNTNLVKYAHKYGVERFIGILSTCIYPDVVDEYPITEEMLHLGPPTKTNFSYGYAKRSLAVQIDAYNQQYGTKYQYLTPCNLYGQYDKWGQNSHFVAALIKKIMFAMANGDNRLGLFGTGKPLRQFMHSDDLAWIIKHCIDNDITESFNVATEENLTIDEIARIAIQIIDNGTIGDILYDSTKPDGQYRKDVSIEKMNKLIPEFKAIPLRDGIKQTFEYLKANQITP
jgi:GDP-L-fucose synthase